MANENEKSNWEKIKSFFWNAIVGAIIISIVGFSWLGWVTGGTAQQEAKQMSEETVNDRLAKICVYQAIQDPGKDLKLKELKEKSSYEKDDYVMVNDITNEQAQDIRNVLNKFRTILKYQYGTGWEVFISKNADGVVSGH